ncbi:hypothetical protein ANCCEY_02225 [Ancylostoma ceylanicum]|uniref:Uncharacterized protein n=1 Tax=Ancylostoma ceylanicum TaxID=53326 RepID=A0A0D6M8D1_9BILA|nr:hypothetical protein ANCCEY_02225 [Ancylostoma ceylanicum]
MRSRIGATVLVIVKEIPVILIAVICVAIRSHSEPQELNYEEINDRNSRSPEKPSRFNVKPGKLKKKLNPQLHTERGCTDVACCFLFLLFTIGWGVVAAIGE